MSKYQGSGIPYCHSWRRLMDSAQRDRHGVMRGSDCAVVPICIAMGHAAESSAVNERGRFRLGTRRVGSRART